MNGRFVWRLVIALVLVAVVVGLGFVAFNAGYAQGALDSGKIVAPVGGIVPPVYGPLFFRPWGFGFGPFACLFPLFGVFLLFGLMRVLFWGGRWGGHHHGERGVPPMFEDWHRKAHEAPTAEASKAQ